jgi:hypothetical protein
MSFSRTPGFAPGTVSTADLMADVAEISRAYQSAFSDVDDHYLDQAGWNKPECVCMKKK